MRFKHLFAFLLVISVAFVVGCGSDDDNNNWASTKTIKTTLSAPTKVEASVRGNIAGGIRAQVESSTKVTGAKVTLTMADGTTYTMTDNGNGEYSAVVSNIPGNGGFYIEAHKGDLELQNLFTSLPEDLTGITTDHLTTAFTQVALTAAKALAKSSSPNVTFASPVDLLKNASSISLDVSTLRKEVLDESNVTYETARTLVAVALTKAEPDAVPSDGKSIIDKLAEGTLAPTIDNTSYSWTEVVAKPIEVGEILPPVTLPQDDEAAIKQVVASLVDYFRKGFKGKLNASDTESLSALLSENGFIHNGMKKEDFLLMFSSDMGEDEKEDKVTDISALDDIVLRKVDDVTYVVAPIAQITRLADDYTFTREENGFKYGYTPATFSAFPPTTFRANSLKPDDMFPMILKKEQLSDKYVWKIVGNGIKVQDAYMELHNSYNGVGNQATFISLGVRHADNFPITSVVFSGTHVDGNVSLVNNPSEGDSDKWTLPDNQSYPPNGGWGSSLPAVVHKNGDTYNFVVTFSDNSTQMFKYTVSNIPSSWQPLDATVQCDAASITVAWPKVTSFGQWFDKYSVSIQNLETSGDNRVLEGSYYDINKTSVNVPFSSSPITNTSYPITVRPGAYIGVMVQAKNVWGIVSSCWREVSVP